MWEPLPLIVYGYATHPLAPSRRDTRLASRHRLSTVTEASVDDNSALRDIVPLEVGDEVYAFEKYTPRGRECDGPWYRGYVVCTARRPNVTWSIATDSNSATPEPPAKANEEQQQVFIGIFPASHIHVRDELCDAEGFLLMNHMNGGQHGLGTHHPPSTTSGSVDFLSTWSRERGIGMDTLKEEGEDTSLYTSRKSFRLGPPPDQANSSRAGLPVYSTSLRSMSPAESSVMKPLPPRPSLKSGDDTAFGAAQPIIDEISSALREWHMLMFQYLARRDYKLFHTVKEHIEILHSGRRQLLAQTLSAEETINMRHNCVARLVSGNIVQGLDVIVRHPTWGGLVTVDGEGNVDSRAWVSAVRMYSMQVSLAYMNVLLGDTKILALGQDASPLPGSASSAFPDWTQTGHSRSLSFLSPDRTGKLPTARFYHVYLDLRAFVASPCAPGETAELFFSLYRKQGVQFVTEEFCAILNHNGVLARDPSNRIRTLFVDLSSNDVQDPIFLVCRIVRNGALKQGHNMGSGTPNDTIKRGSDMAPRIESTVTWADSVSAHKPLLPNEPFRRPFGCAVLELTQLSKMVADDTDVTTLKEHNMPIYIPTNEASFSMLHQNIINSNTKEFEKSPRAEMLAVSVKVFRGEAETIIRENTSLLQGIPHTLRLGFPDVVFPGNLRNELYIKLWCGDFLTTHNTTGRLSMATFARGQVGHTTNTIQVSVEVRDRDGGTIENVISQGSGEALMTTFHSMVYQRCNEPTFGELIKIVLPPSGSPQWHLFFTFRNRTNRERGNSRVNPDPSERPFAFAFQPLFPENSAFMEDGTHTLIMYRADKLGQLTTTQYLAAPSSLAPGQRIDQLVIDSEVQRLVSPLRDTLTIRSSLCSTQLTHNSILLQLLNWEDIKDTDVLTSVLTQFTFVAEVEIVKFLRDIFDSLFSILVASSHQSAEVDSLIFNALVTVLGIVQDRRFSNFQPVLDVYIEKHFTCAAASSHMIYSMNRLLSNPVAPENASPLRAALKVWHYVFKFIARSRELQKAKELGMGGGATAEHLENNFKRELRSHLHEVTRMMSASSPSSIIGTQTIALQHFTSILPQLAKIFSTIELVSIVTTFANAVTVGKGKIMIWKLVMYLQVVKGFLFDNPESRPLLVEAVVIWIKPHFGRYDEYLHTNSSDSEAIREVARINWLESIRLCTTIIAVMLDKLQRQLVSPAVIADRAAHRQEQDNVENLLPLLSRLLESYRELQNPVSRKVLIHNRLSTALRATVPVTFPESYPFSMLLPLPDNSPNPPHGIKEGANDNKMYNSALGETAIVFLVLILTSPTRHVVNFLQSSLDIEGRDRFVNLLSQLFKVGTSILDNEAFPKSWLNVNILAHKVLIRMMEPIGTILEKEFIPPPELETTFNINIWREGMTMLLRLLSSDQLVIEDFSAQKRRAIWRLAGDLRLEGAALMLNLWQSLGWSEHLATNGEPPIRYGGYQGHLRSLVGHVVNLCLSHHDQLRNNAVQILFNMMVSEYHAAGHFDTIEHELVTRLDSLFMSDSKGDDISKAFFIGRLKHLFEITDVDEQLRERVSSFLDSVDLFLELLLSVRDLPEGEEYADDRVIATLRLMNFIRRIGRDEIYIKYVHQLVNMHLQSQNYVEAALTLKLHSDLHEWDTTTFVPPMEDLGLPQQSQFHRKETLCLLILDYLGKGKAWESAIQICKELAHQHAEVTFNYGRLAEILRHEAALMEHIITEQRYYPDYYRVTFYGNFPVAIRDKRFIYRGYEWEKFGAFCERMLNKHPGAQLLKTPGDPPVDIRFGNDQWIQCTAVTPEPNRQSPIFTNPDVPLAVRAYYEHCDVNLFNSSRQMKKIQRDGTEEVWTERTYYTTEESFPTVLRRSEVVNVEIVEISPLESALVEVEAKTKELTALNVRYRSLAQTSQVVSTNALSMSLNSAVDAPLNTGIASYRQTFFNPDYVARNPERAGMVEKLRSSIDEQVRVIDDCLRLHGHLCPPEFIPFHETLLKFFKKNFRDEVRRLGMDGTSDTLGLPLPPRNLATVGNPGTSLISSSMQPYPQSPIDYEDSLNRSLSSGSTTKPSLTLPALNLGPAISIMPGILTPQPPLISPTTSTMQPARQQQTPLQRHLAHLARHGFGGVSSAPNDTSGSDSLSTESPQNSFVNVGASNGNGIHSTATPQPSSTSAAASTIGSMGSLGSLKGRFSRFGSLNFGKRGNTSTS